MTSKDYIIPVRTHHLPEHCNIISLNIIVSFVIFYSSLLPLHGRTTNEDDWIPDLLVGLCRWWSQLPVLDPRRRFHQDILHVV